MNRSFHVKETLVKNLHDNFSYKNLEFVLLDYNSQDDLEDWAKIEIKKFIDNGLVLYIKTFEPTSWNVSHAKNLALKHASGNIVCNVDADQFLGVGYADYVNAHFNNDPNIFLTGRTPGAKNDANGRVCMWKCDFIKLRGYDEGIKGYGYDDSDLYYRLKKLGREERYIELSYLKSIPHGDLDRIKNTLLFKKVKYIFFRNEGNGYEAFVLEKNKDFKYIVLQPGVENDQAIVASINEEKTIEGSWEEFKDKISFITNGNLLKLEKRGDNYYYGQKLFKRVTPNDTEEISTFLSYALLLNQKVYVQNKHSELSTCNEDGFGKGLIYKNFNY